MASRLPGTSSQRATSAPADLHRISARRAARRRGSGSARATSPSSAAIWRRTSETRSSSSPPVALVDERDQPVADLELERVERQRVPHRLGALQGGSRLRDLRRLVRARRSSAMPRRMCAPKPATSAPTIRNGILRHARNERRAARSRAPAMKSGRGWREDLPGDRRSRALAAGRARDDDAGRRRDQERRDLRGDAVADGQELEGLERLARTPMPCWSIADRDAARTG